MGTPFHFWVGVDQGDESHRVCLTDEKGEVEQRSFEHSGSGLGEMADWLAERSGGKPHTVGVAIEVPRGPVVETLLERGFALFAVNPKQLDRFRDRYTVAGAKDDSRDAMVLGQSLRTDEPAFRRLEPEDPCVIRLRELTRLDEELKQELRRLANRLRDQLHRYYPQIVKLDNGVDEPWVWDLLELAPTPERAQKLSRGRIERLLRARRIRRVSAEEVVAGLRTPPLAVAPGVVEAATIHVQVLLPRLSLIFDQKERGQDAIEALLNEMLEDKREHRDVSILRSLPGAGNLVSATMLAEAARPLKERDYHALRLQAGVAPVTRRSGKTHRVSMRRSCNPRLRFAVHVWMQTVVQHDDRARALYQAHRQAGHTHSRALRSVADRYLKLLVTLLKNGTPYDAQLRRAA